MTPEVLSADSSPALMEALMASREWRDLIDDCVGPMALTVMDVDYVDRGSLAIVERSRQTLVQEELDDIQHKRADAIRQAVAYLRTNISDAVDQACNIEWERLKDRHSHLSSGHKTATARWLATVVSVNNCSN